MKRSEEAPETLVWVAYQYSMSDALKHVDVDAFIHGVFLKEEDAYKRLFRIHLKSFCEKKIEYGLLDDGEEFPFPGMEEFYRNSVVIQEVGGRTPDDLHRPWDKRPKQEIFEAYVKDVMRNRELSKDEVVKCLAGKSFEEALTEDFIAKYGTWEERSNALNDMDRREGYYHEQAGTYYCVSKEILE